MAAGPPFAYRALAALAALPALAYTLARALRDGGGAYLRQRYALGLPADLAGRVCLHCSSVGEVRAALPLARLLQRDGRRLLLSVATPTGRRVARGLLPEVPRVYFPLDHRTVARRWLARLAPRAVLVFETELWPHFYAAAAARGAPLALVNARLSARTARPPRPLRRAFRQAARTARCILARGEADAARFRELGAAADRVAAVGNLKYAAPADADDEGPPLPVPYALAASTHADEERRLAALWRALPDRRGHLLAIMPRHPERAARLAAALRRAGFRVRRHSRDGRPAADTELYLADTLGELPRWLRHASFAFLGGSLVPRGGHNVLEPAALGRACAVGPHTGNFADEVAALRACGGLAQARDEAELAGVFARWLAEPAAAAATGARARAHVRAHADMAERYAAELRRRGALPE